jgi:protein phosphatase
LQANLKQIVKKALEIHCKSFIRTVEEATELLRKENGKIGNLTILGRLVKLEPSGEALIVGDLHGDLDSLIDIFKDSDFLKEMKHDKNAILIFLGDYGDRGEYSTEVYYIVLKLKLLFPKQVVLMRGNHEGPEDLMVSPHDLPNQFQVRFGGKWKDVYAKIHVLFNYLYNATIVEKRYLMIHGGLPPEANSIEDLAYAHAKNSKLNFLEDMLWSDPSDAISDVYPSPRGAGRLFGINVTTRVLERLKVKILIRGHEPCYEGFKINHNGKVLTLFSRKGSPYFNDRGAYLKVNLAQKFADAEKLLPYIHSF